MSPVVQALGIDQMSREQRIALVQDIWDSIAAEPAPPLLAEEHHRELLQRITDDDHHPDDVTPWETVKTQTLARLQQ